MATAGADIEAKLNIVIDENEALERENALFDTYLERAKRRVNSGAHEEDEVAETPVTKSKKKEAKKVGQTEVTIDQKTEIAQQEVEDLKDEIETTKEKSEKLLDRLLAITEECDMRIAQVKKDVYEFRREIVIGGENPRTGKIVAEKVIRYFEEKLRQKVRRTVPVLSEAPLSSCVSDEPCAAARNPAGFDRGQAQAEESGAEDPDPKAGQAARGKGGDGARRRHVCCFVGTHSRAAAAPREQHGARQGFG
jgi:hypothetical protein